MRHETATSFLYFMNHAEERGGKIALLSKTSGITLNNHVY